MFYHLEGTVSELAPNLAVLDCGGLGFALNVTTNTLSRLKVGQRAKLYISESIGETNFDLFGFADKGESGDVFAFRTGRSRETSFSRDYDDLYELLRYEKHHGNILWVMGPACTFDHDSRAAFSGLVREGYVHGLLAGNALATHDLEGAYLKTALGQDIYTQENQPLGHYNHLDTLNRVRACGSIEQFIREEKINDGIISSCVEKNVPFVLGGSIRDDGPLPETIGDVYAAQDRMR